ncbi:hypothetical protein ABZ569_34000 [Streptomyces albus]|uniref:hypothetical protein n=1 Tax=Streptomyces albus TaxID=1888 RepID=UPI003403525E
MKTTSLRDFHADDSPCGHRHTPSSMPLEEGCPGRSYWLASCTCGWLLRSTAKGYADDRRRHHRDEHKKEARATSPSRQNPMPTPSYEKQLSNELVTVTDRIAQTYGEDFRPGGCALYTGDGQRTPGIFQATYYDEKGVAQAEFVRVDGTPVSAPLSDFAKLPPSASPSTSSRTPSAARWRAVKSKPVSAIR